MHLRAKTGKDFGANSDFKSARMAKLWQFSQGHPKPTFSEKVQRADQGKLFKNRPKRCPRWKGQKALSRKWHYPLISMHLKNKDWKRFRRKQRLQRCPNGQVMAIFGGSPKTRMFGKKANGRPRETFKKSPKKYPSLQKAKNTLAKMSLSWNLYPFYTPKTGEDFGAQGGSKSARMAKLLQAIFARSPKTRIFCKSAKGGPTKIFQKSPKK